ncbi:alpha/beta-hydrolase [Lentinus tigrinus ALCF2SS1-7]|uniref:alpha/beta-hydrolase n=1 Tax=Lentinus tigrinus ALCF2SS1-7 TaxID=1328758 RepID=UPI0011663AE5|nr:alpha/beta-hydrolase [Lentinus tigrinus ALCF2SS1-7]
MSSFSSFSPDYESRERIRMLTSPDGTKIWAESAGDASKPALVFIHGLSCTALGWDEQFADPGLRYSFHLVRYEMRGHGRSGKPVEEEDYESIKIAQDFRTVCEAFGVVKPFVAGWSLGGSIVVDVVTAYGPDYISGIIYVGGSILALHYHPVCRHPVMTSLFPVITSLTSDDLSAGAEEFVESCVKAPLTFPAKLLFMGGFIMQPRAARYWSLKRSQDHAVWERTAGHLPVLIIQGKEDLHCLYETMIGIAKRIYDDVEVHLMNGVGHSPHFESPMETNRFIYDWLRRKTERRAKL